MYRAVTLTVAITLILPACRSREDAGASDSAADTAATARADTGTVAAANTGTKAAADTAMADMTALGKVVSRMYASMEAHMLVMDTAGAATMQSRMPRHHRMADSLLSRMNEEVRTMNIPTDAIWPATVDSVRQDLSRLRSTTASDMTAMMPAHLVRIRWLIQMHRTMTGKTPP